MVSKSLFIEVNLHSWILKDQNEFSASLHYLAQIAFLEGNPSSALKMDMLCHSYMMSLPLIESSIKQTFEHLIS